MSLSEDRPNFNIVASKPTTVDYVLFKEDFLNPKITVRELRDKHSLSPSEYREYRVRVLDETGLTKKPANYGRDTQVRGETFIQRRFNGYVIAKTTDNVTKYYGRYKNLGTAKYVRDRLVESDWDDVLAFELKKEFASVREKPTQIKAMECYSEFEDLYLNSSYTIKEIRQRMGISSRTYLHLLKMIKENHGKLYRRK